MPVVKRISNAILANTEMLAKASLLGGFAYGFLQTLKTGESVSKTMANKIKDLTRSARVEESEGVQMINVTGMNGNNNNNNNTNNTNNNKEDDDDDNGSTNHQHNERKRVNTAVAWSSMSKI